MPEEGEGGTRVGLLVGGRLERWPGRRGGLWSEVSGGGGGRC